MKALYVLVIFVILFSYVKAADPPLCSADGKITVTEVALDGEITVIKWISPDATNKVDAIFLLTDAYSLYRSGDEGKTFDKQSLGDILSIYTTKDPSYIWFLGNVGNLWVTQDQGVTYLKRQNTMDIKKIFPHPNEATTAFALVNTPHCRNTTIRGTCRSDLYITEDFGTTWKFVTNYVYDVSWGSAGTSSTISPRNLFVIKWKFPDVGSNDTLGPNQSLLKSYDLHFMSSSNLFNTTDNDFEHSIAQLYSNGVLFFAKALSSSFNSELELYVTLDEAKTIQKVQFPTNDAEAALSEFRYTILDISESVAFINVDHSNDNWGNTYGSDQLDQEFSLILSYNRRNRNGKVDFKRIKGLDGIYIANHLIGLADNSPLTDDSKGQSLITFEKGGKWSTLKKPAKDSNGQDIKCDSNCSLHLFGETQSDFSPFFSTENAIGLIIGTGHVGPYLLNEKDEVNTFFSRNGGVDWYEVAKGEFIYDFADHGSIILMVPISDPETNQLMYSMNEGLDWVKCVFANEAVTPKDILVEPTATSRNFLIRAVKYINNKFRTFLYHVDYSNYHERECGTSDYEEWSPTDDQGRCLLGSKNVYTRRKRDALCFNNQDYEHKKFVSYCTCTRDDYECDFCYELGTNLTTGEKNICTFFCSSHTSVVEPANCTGSWYKTRGYRKVEGNKCTDDANSLAKWAPVLTVCSGNLSSTADASGDGTNMGGGGGGKMSLGVVFVVVFLILAVLAILSLVALIVVSRYNPKVKEFLDHNFPQFMQPCWGHIPKGKKVAGGYHILGQKDSGNGEDDTSILESTDLFVDDDDEDDDDDDLKKEPEDVEQKFNL